MIVASIEPGVIFLNNLTNDYVELVEHVRLNGDKVQPRGQATHEMLDQTIVLENIDVQTMPIGVGRKCNPRIGAVEAVQLIGGFEDAKLSTTVSPQLAEFTENDGHFWGSYGRRIGNQLLYVEQKLRADRDTRQAQILLWDPVLDNQPGKADYPCTLALSFRIRFNKLEMHTTMRSNDVWRGTAYDIFQFTQLQWTLANALDIQPGRYIHTAHSLHLYERDVPATVLLRKTSTDLPRTWPIPRGLHTKNDPRYYDNARSVANGTWQKSDPQETIQWYLRQLHPGEWT